MACKGITLTNKRLNKIVILFKISSRRIHTVRSFKYSISIHKISNIKRRISTPALKSFDGPTPLPIVGNALSISSDFEGFHSDCIAKYGPTFSLKMPGLDIIATIDPALAEYTLSLQRGNNGRNYSDRYQVPILQDMMKLVKPDTDQYTGLVFANGDKYWAQPRKVVGNSLLQQSFLINSAKTVNRHAKKFVNKLKAEMKDDKVSFEANAKFGAFFGDIIGELGFGVNFGFTDGNESRLAELLQRQFEFMEYFMFQPAYWKYLPSPKKNEFYREIEEFIELMKPVTQTALDRTKIQSTEDDSSFLDVLARACHDGDMEPIDIQGHASNMLAAGMDTTKMSISMIMYLLGKNPEYQQKIYDELYDLGFITSSNNENNISYELSNKLAMTSAVIKEGMRIYPAAYVNGRSAIDDDEWNGYKIPKGTSIWTLIYHSHRYDKYFPDPLKFEPERFLNDRRGSSYHSLCYMPFGHGARQCIGFRLAQLEMRITLAFFIKHFKWSVAEESKDVKLGFGSTTLQAKTPIILQMESRS